MCDETDKMILGTGVKVLYLGAVAICVAGVTEVILNTRSDIMRLKLENILLKEELKERDKNS